MTFFSSFNPVQRLRVVGKSSNQTRDTTGLVDVDDLLFPVKAGRLYHFRFGAIHKSDSLVTGLQLGVSVPGSGTVVAQANFPAGVGLDVIANETAYGVSDIPLTNTDYLARVEGMAYPLEDGDLKLQFCASSNAGTITLRAGSLGLLTPIT